MELYRVLLVDDEEEIRESMAHRVNWKELGFEIAGFAENGMEALEVLEKDLPDVIMTDIRMPFLSGLEFVEKAVEIRPTAKIIIFSGFDDFEYAQKAITLNVEAYILKPISSIQLSQTLRELKMKMDAEVEEQQNIEKLKKNYIESLPVMKEQFLISLIEGRVQEQDIFSKAKQYQIAMKGNWHTVILFQVSHSLSGKDIGIGISKTSEKLIPIALKKAVDAVLGKFHGIQSFIYVDHVAVIAQLEWESQIKILMNEINEVCKKAKDFIGKMVTAGIGGIYKNPESIRDSYQEAYSALEYGTLLGREGSYVTYIYDIEPDHGTRAVLNKRNEQTLLSAIKLGKKDMIQSKIDQLFSELKNLHMPYSQYQVYILQIFTSVLSLGADYGDIYISGLNNINNILQMHSLEQIKEWITDICLKISEEIGREQMDSRKYIVNKAKILVDEYYDDDTLSADKICEQLNVSTAYFSTIFKKEEKVNFVTYLTEVRLKHALHLLETTSDKTYIIAAKVGYAESNYFSYVFKKKYGVSPSKYRSNFVNSK